MFNLRLCFIVYYDFLSYFCVTMRIAGVSPMSGKPSRRGEKYKERKMGKGKLAKFADMASYPHVFEYPYSVVDDVPFEMKGHWCERFFRNGRPIVLELGCGRGEYTTGLARLYPEKNFIGVDIKGARMWTGATEALREGLPNVAFLRTNIEMIDRFFDRDEVAEIWLTFSDPQMKKVTKRLTSTFFMERYRRFLQDRGRVHLYHSVLAEQPDTEEARILGIQTYYEQQWLERGLNIRYMRFLLPREGRLEEPDVEIEMDEYRSYNRSKRSGSLTSK